MSENSSELSEAAFLQKRRNERFAYLLGVFTQFIWSLNGLQLKSYQPSFPECYSNNSVVFWRSLPVMILGYVICKQRNVRITPHKEIKHMVWFYLRSVGNYFCVALNLKVLSYFRLSTARVFFCCQPLVIIYLSIIVLNESFYIRYLAGIIICLCGSSIIVLNDKKPQSRKTILNNNVVEGLFFACLFLIFGSFNAIGQKMLVKDGMQADVQNFYLGFYNMLPAMIVCIYEGHFAFTHIKYILYCISNGFLFYLGNYLTSVCYQYIAISKFLPVLYLNIVFTFFLSIFVLGESLYFSDLVGAILIIGFQLWNIYNPPARDTKNQDKEKFLGKMDKDESEDNMVFDIISRHSNVGKD